MHRLGFVRYVIAIVAFAAVVGAPAFGGTSTVTESLVLAPSPRTAAIGGLHTTLADGYDTLTANPAGFRAVPAGIQAAEVTMRLSGPVLSLSSIILEAVDEGFETVFASPETLSELQRLYASVGLFGPISFGFVGDGLGFAVSNTTDVTLRTVGTTELSAVAKEGLLLSGGFALRMPLPERAGELDTGVLLKGFVQGASRVETSLLALPDLFTSFDTDLILEAPFDVATGLSVDVGVRYQILPWLAFGLTGQNLLAPAIVNTYDSLTGFLDNEDAVSETDARIPINVSAGVAFTPGLGSLDRHISGFKVLLDYRDGLDFWTDPDNVENPLLKIALGVETTLLDVVSVR
ncbi:MAG: hypothetical protein ACOCYG_08520, partial [Spirochaetota bacterium]